MLTSVSRAFSQILMIFGGAKRPLPEGYYEVTVPAEKDFVTLHRGAAIYSPLYTTVRNGERVYVFPPAETLGAEWCRVEYRHVSAWMQTRYLKPTSAPAF